MANERAEKKYNLVLGKDGDGIVTILDEVFRYGDGFSGATGTMVRPVTSEEISIALSLDEKTSFYEENWRYDAGSQNGTELSLKEYVRRIPKSEYLDSRFEPYEPISARKIAALLGDEEPERYEVIGCGRIFPVDTLVPIDSDEVRAAIADINNHERNKQR